MKTFKNFIRFHDGREPDFHRGERRYSIPIEKLYFLGKPMINWDLKKLGDVNHMKDMAKHIQHNGDNSLPPIMVSSVKQKDGTKKYEVEDGFHRTGAHILLKRKKIKAVLF